MVGDTDPKHTSLSGLELFQQLKDGQITPSPWAVLADLHVLDLGEGRAVLSATPDERHLNQIGLVHGGWVTTLMDSALDGAAHCGHIYHTINYDGVCMEVLPTVRQVLLMLKLIHQVNLVTYQGTALPSTKAA